jgi:hypothetical protein
MPTEMSERARRLYERLRGDITEVPQEPGVRYVGKLAQRTWTDEQARSLALLLDDELPMTEEHYGAPWPVDPGAAGPSSKPYCDDCGTFHEPGENSLCER